MRSLAPLYIEPHRTDAWEAATAQLRSGDVAIINPASGPGLHADPVWSDRIYDLHVRGVKAFGYQALNYGYRHGDPHRPTAWNAADSMLRWTQLYPIDGFFLDEMPSEGSHPQVAALILLGRRLTSPRRDSMDSQRITVNPGRPPTERLVESMPMVAAWVVHENLDAAPGSTDDVTPPIPSTEPGLTAARQCWLSYGDPAPAATTARCVQLGYGWSYATTDPGQRGNPWNSNPDD